MSLIVNYLKAFSLLLLSATIILLAVPDACAHHCRYYKPDARNLCLAKNENKRFYCSYIKDPDQQRYCYSYMDKSPNGCDSIQDETLKEQCRGEAQSRLDEMIAQQKALEAEAEAKKAVEEAAKQTTSTAGPANAQANAQANGN